MIGALLARRLGLLLAQKLPDEPTNTALPELRSSDVRLVGRVAGQLVERIRASAAATPPGKLAGRWTPVTLGELGIDIREELSRSSLTFRLPRGLETGVRRTAERLGIDGGRPVACLQARDSGFKADGADTSFDTARNGRIETYGPAATLLAGSGFTVVRVGDPSSAPFVCPHVIDLATSDARTDALELFVCLRAHLFVTADAGASRTAFLTGAPLLTVNAINVLPAYPLRPADRILPKRILDRQTGTELPLAEMALAGLRKEPERYELIDNTPGEILEAVREMLDVLKGETGRDANQQSCHDALEALWFMPKLAAKRERKGAASNEILGHGAISRIAAAKSVRSAPNPDDL